MKVVAAAFLHCPINDVVLTSSASFLSLIERRQGRPYSTLLAAERRRRQRRIDILDNPLRSSPYSYKQQQQQQQKVQQQATIIPRSMSLIPAPINELETILPTPTHLSPTGEQYMTYFGHTPRERYNSLFEGISIAFVGSMLSYFISFIIGQFLATCFGVLCIFWPILGPEVKAYQRNWELLAGRPLVDVWMDDDDNIEDIIDGDDTFILSLPENKRGLYGAYYIATIQDVCVVDDVRATASQEYDLVEFNQYTQDRDEMMSITGIPWKLRLRLSDMAGREMQVHCRLSEEYLPIQCGMTAVGVLLSTSRKFTKLAGMTDFCILNVLYDDDTGDDDDDDDERQQQRGGAKTTDANVEVVTWVGDYPYLDKAMFLRTLNKNGITDKLIDDYYYDKQEVDMDDTDDTDEEE
jgi:hypothetical protein